MPGGSKQTHGCSQPGELTGSRARPRVQFYENYDVRMKRRQGILPWQDPMTDATMHRSHPYAQQREATHSGYITPNGSRGQPLRSGINGKVAGRASTSRSALLSGSNSSSGHNHGCYTGDRRQERPSARRKHGGQSTCGQAVTARPMPDSVGAAPIADARRRGQHAPPSRRHPAVTTAEACSRTTAESAGYRRSVDASRTRGRLNSSPVASSRRHSASTAASKTLWCYVCMCDFPNNPREVVRCCPSGACTVCVRCLHVLLDFHDRHNSLHTIQCPGTCRQHVPLSHILHTAAACVDDDTRDYYKTAHHQKPQLLLIKCPTCLRAHRHSQQSPRATCSRCQCEFCVRHGVNKARYCRGCRPEQRRSRIMCFLPWLRTWRCSRCGSRERPKASCAYFTCTCGSRICWHCGKLYQQGRHGRELFPTLARFHMQCNDKTLWAKRVAACVLGPPAALLLGAATVAAIPFYITYKLGYCLFDGCCCTTSPRQASATLDTPSASRTVF